VREADHLTTLMCRMSWKSGSLNLLEPSGPHRACYGEPLPLTFTLVLYAQPNPVEARSEAWICVRSLSGISGSNPAGVFDVCVFCQVEVSAAGRSLVRRSPTECGVSGCDLEDSLGAVEPWEKVLYINIAGV